MDKVSNNEAVEFFKFLELPENRFLVNGEVVDIFTILGFQPEYRPDGTRKLTPYEIIGIPPHFYSDGRERPIVFYIKNKVRRLGRYEGNNKEFFRINGKIQEKKTTLDELKTRYKRAIYEGREYDALEILKIIDQMTGGRADEFLRSFFNSRKFYKKMRKQLILDIFAHFFMMFIKYRKTMMKTGVMRTTKIFKPYRENSEEMESGDMSFDEMSVVDFSANVPLESELASVSFEQTFTDGSGGAIEHEPAVEAFDFAQSQPIEMAPSMEPPQAEVEENHAEMEDHSMGKEHHEKPEGFGFNFFSHNHVSEDEKFNEQDDLSYEKYYDMPLESDEFGNNLNDEDFNFLANKTRRVHAARGYINSFAKEPDSITSDQVNKDSSEKDEHHKSEKEAALNFDI